MFKRALTALTVAMTLGLAPTAQAQTFPTKPVRIITPFPVGSGPEGVARLVADKLSKSWGQPVTVENRPGGNGFIAIDAFKRGATDGTDLIQLDNVHLTAYPHLFKKLPYNAASDFDVLLPLFKTFFFFTAHSSPSPIGRPIWGRPIEEEEKWPMKKKKVLGEKESLGLRLLQFGRPTRVPLTTGRRLPQSWVLM